MKVVIWVVGLLTASLIVTTIRFAFGFILGGIPTALLYGATFGICGYLCKRWDIKHGKDSKNNNQKHFAKKSDD